MMRVCFTGLFLACRALDIVRRDDDSTGSRPSKSPRLSASNQSQGAEHRATASRKIQSVTGLRYSTGRDVVNQQPRKYDDVRFLVLSRREIRGARPRGVRIRYEDD